MIPINMQYILLLSIFIILLEWQLLYSENIKTEYANYMQYYSLPQLIEKEKSREAIRLFFIPRGRIEDGDVNLCIFDIPNSNSLHRLVVQSRWNLYGCLESSRITNAGKDSCRKVESYSDTIHTLTGIFKTFKHLMLSYKQKQDKYSIYDGKMCIIEYATKDTSFRIEVELGDTTNEKSLLLGFLIYFYDNNNISLGQTWLRNQYQNGFKTNKVDSVDIRVRLMKTFGMQMNECK